MVARGRKVRASSNAMRPRHSSPVRDEHAHAKRSAPLLLAVAAQNDSALGNGRTVPRAASDGSDMSATSFGVGPAFSSLLRTQ